MRSDLISIRLAAKPDIPLLAGWMAAFFDHLKSSTADPYFIGAVFSREAAVAHFEAALAEGWFVALAELGGRPAGYLLARIEKPFVHESPIRAIGHVSHCYVEPDARRRGVVRRLVREAEDWFRSRDLSYAELSYQFANSLAASTWPALGYETFRVYGRKRLTNRDD